MDKWLKKNRAELLANCKGFESAANMPLHCLRAAETFAEERGTALEKRKR